MIITNSLGLPQPFVDACKSDYEYKPKRYSVTSILKGTRENLLMRRHNDEILQDASDMVWLIFGTAVHKILEEAEPGPWQYQEFKVETKVANGYTLSGVIDFFDDKNHIIADWKTGSVWKVINGDFEDYRLQLLAYAWLLEQNGFTFPRHAQIVMVLKDHSPMKARNDASYPQHAVHVEHFEFNDDDKQFIEHLILDKLLEIQKYEEAEDDELPPCSAEERWKTPDRYAVMKKGRKTALRLLDSEKDAYQWLADNGYAGDAKVYIEHRIGESRKCKDYCSACEFCDFYHKEVQNGQSTHRNA